jgi:hypothetical protein
MQLLKQTTFITMLLALFLTSCGALKDKMPVVERKSAKSLSQSDENQLVVKDEALSERTLQIVENAEMKVSGYVLDVKKDSVARNFQGFKILDGTSSMPYADSLRNVILSPNAFIANGASKQCGFSPSLGFEFKENGKVAMLLLMDFDCNVAKFYDTKTKQTQIRDFDNVKSRMIAFAEKSFGQPFKDRQKKGATLPTRTIKNKKN